MRRKGNDWESIEWERWRRLYLKGGRGVFGREGVFV